MASILDKLTQSGYGAVRKIKDATDTSRIKVLLAEEKENLKAAYEVLGKYYYENICQEDVPQEEACAALILQIGKNLEKIQKYEEEIRLIKRMIVCPSCGKEADYDSMFCGHCGADLSAVKITMDMSRYCSQCGERLMGNATFCPSCGQKV